MRRADDNSRKWRENGQTLLIYIMLLLENKVAAHVGQYVYVYTKD